MAQPEGAGRRCGARWRRRRAASSGGSRRCAGISSAAEGADAMAQRAQLFVAEAARAPRGATRLAAVDWSSGQAREVELKLDPARGAREQIDALFKRARRLKEGARIGRARLAEAEKALARLALVAAQLAEAADGELAPLGRTARAAAPRDFKLAPSLSPAPLRAAPTHAQPPLPPYRTFLSRSGARILVGRGADRNDALTFHVARPHDLWLHAKNRTGAHVVVPARQERLLPGRRARRRRAPGGALLGGARRGGRRGPVHARAATCGSRAGAPPGWSSSTARRCSSFAGKTTACGALLERETE